MIHFIVEKGLVFITAYEADYPKKLGKAFLLEIKELFERFIRKLSGSDVDIYTYVAGIRRSYTFIKFDRVIRKTLKNYENSNSSENLSKIDNELYEIKGIINKNLELLANRE